MGRSGQDSGDGEPAEELIAEPPGQPQEPDRGQAVECGHREFECELHQMHMQVRSGGRRRRQRCDDPSRQPACERVDQDRGYEQHDCHAAGTRGEDQAGTLQSACWHERAEQEEQSTERTGRRRCPDGQVVRSPAGHYRQRYQEEVG